MTIKTDLRMALRRIDELERRIDAIERERWATDAYVPVVDPAPVSFEDWQPPSRTE